MQQTMKESKRLIIVFLILLASTTCTFAQVHTSEEGMPYNVGEMNIPLSLTRTYQESWSGYTKTMYDPYFTGGHDVTFVNFGKTINYSIATGIDLHLPFIYLLASQDRSRFRVADDLGLGCLLGSNTHLRRDYFTNARLESPVIKSAVGGSIAFWAGVQAFYRVSNLLDVGVKYYPFYMYLGLEPDLAAAIRGYGLHARVGKVYADLLWVTFGAKDKSKPNTTMAKIKYLYAKKKNNYVFLNWMYNHQTNPNTNTIGVAMPAEVAAVKTVVTKWSIFQTGWGIMF